MQNRTQQRSGKWTEEEEAFAQALMGAFHSGWLDIEEGVSLRKLLAKKLMCSPKRVSKKYEGTNYKGKLQYARDYDIPEAAIMVRKAEIERLEQRFLLSIAGLEAQEASRNQGTFSTSLPSTATGTGSPAANYSVAAYPHASQFLSAGRDMGLPRRGSANIPGIGSSISSDPAALAHFRQLMAAGRQPNVGLWPAGTGTGSGLHSFSGTSLPGGFSSNLVGANNHSFPMTASASGLSSLTSTLHHTCSGDAYPMLNTQARMAGLPGQSTTDQLHASILSRAGNSSSSLEGLRRQLMQEESAAGRANVMSRAQGEIMAMKNELAYLQHVNMLEKQEAERRLSSSMGQAAFAGAAQQTGKRPRSDAPGDLDYGGMMQPSYKRGNLSQGK